MSIHCLEERSQLQDLARLEEEAEEERLEVEGLLGVETILPLAQEQEAACLVLLLLTLEPLETQMYLEVLNQPVHSVAPLVCTPIRHLLQVF